MAARTESERIVKKAPWALAILLSVACATPYQANSFTGGYTDQQIGEDAYMVSFGGNRYIGDGVVRDYLLLHCAELTLQKGSDWFIISDQSAGDHWAKATIILKKGEKPHDALLSYDAHDVVKYLGPKVRRS